MRKSEVLFSHAAVDCGLMLPEQLAVEFLAQDRRGVNIESVGLKLVKLDVELSCCLYNKSIRNVCFLQSYRMILGCFDHLYKLTKIYICNEDELFLFDI